MIPPSDHSIAPLAAHLGGHPNGAEFREIEGALRAGSTQADNERGVDGVKRSVRECA